MNSIVVDETPTSFDDWFSPSMALPDTDKPDISLLQEYRLGLDHLSVSPPATTLSRHSKSGCHRPMLPCDPCVLEDVLAASRKPNQVHDLAYRVNEIFRIRMLAGYDIPTIGKGVLQDVEIALVKNRLYANCYLAESPFTLCLPLGETLISASSVLPKTTFRVMERLALEYLNARLYGYDTAIHQLLISDFFEGAL